MDRFCSNCGKEVHERFSFCPNCGFPATHPAMAAPGTGGPMSFSPMGHQVYPMQYMPIPYYFRPPMSSKRMLTIAGGVLIVIAASICLLMAIIYIVDLAYWWDETYDWAIALFGFLGIVAFAMGVVAGICCFRLRHFHLAMLGEALVLVSGGIDLDYTEVFGFILIVLSLLSLAFTFAGHEEFKARSGAVQYPPGPYPFAPPMFPAPPGQAPMAPARPPDTTKEALAAADESWDQVAPYRKDGG